MSSMTKDQLREALVAHGVDPPPVNARKAEYIAVYRAQISDLGLFSSDDEDEDDEMEGKTASPKKSNSTVAAKSAQKISRSSSLIVNGENLEDLTDDQLFRRLKDNGIQAGPIVESTRKFYLRKLAEIINGGGDKSETEVEAANASTVVNGKSPGRSSPKKKTSKKIANGLDQFSADEETADEQQPEVIVSKSRANNTTTTTSSTSKTLTPTSLRQRIKDTMEESRDRFTPTPRRSIHSYKVTESSRESLTRSPDGKLSRSYTYKKDTYDSDKDFKNTALGKVVRWLPKIFMLIIFAAVVYYTLQEHGDKLTKVYLQMTKGLPQEPVLDRPSGEGAEPREPLDEQPSIGNV